MASSDAQQDSIAYRSGSQDAYMYQNQISSLANYVPLLQITNKQPAAQQKNGS